MRSTSDSNIRELLRKANLYGTKCRIAMLKVLAKARRPLTQDEIARRMGRNRFNKVTIYRTLESFCRVGLVHKAYMHDRAWHFELADRCGEVRCHPHFTCTSCGVTRCLTDLSFPIVKGLKQGFVIHRQQVRLEGLCPACA